LIGQAISAHGRHDFLYIVEITLLAFTHNEIDYAMHQQDGAESDK
jgi:hypothetical protein